jgi:hypothetical protein
MNKVEKIPEEIANLDEVLKAILKKYPTPVELHYAALLASGTLNYCTAAVSEYYWQLSNGYLDVLRALMFETGDFESQAALAECRSIFNLYCENAMSGQVAVSAVVTPDDEVSVVAPTAAMPIPNGVVVSNNAPINNEMVAINGMPANLDMMAPNPDMMAPNHNMMTLNPMANINGMLVSLPPVDNNSVPLNNSNGFLPQPPGLYNAQAVVSQSSLNSNATPFVPPPSFIINNTPHGPILVKQNYFPQVYDDNGQRLLYIMPFNS